MSSTDSLQSTALLPCHQQLGAKIVEFAGWQMPVQYAGVRTEALAVRENCGLFDVSHMGQLDFQGEGATEELNSVVSADWSKVPVGRAAYALLLNEDGGVQDDVMGYRLGENSWLVVVNASRTQGDIAHFERFLPRPFWPRPRVGAAMLALQGPHSQALLQPMCDFDLSSMKWRDVATVRILGEECVLTRGGYTGSDGFEWMGSEQIAPTLWQTLLDAGALPCGLGARDVLRLEAGLPLYGHELREEWSPDESGCAFAVGKIKSEFVGRASLERKRGEPSGFGMRGLKMSGKAIAREGYVVSRDGQMGEITSGTLSPSLETPIALARVPLEWEMGDEVQVEIRGQKHPARLCALPFIAPARKSHTSS